MNIWMKLSNITILIICNKFHWKKKKESKKWQKETEQKKNEKKQTNKKKKNRKRKEKRIKYISDYENYP